jgi:hypothetical protein
MILNPLHSGRMSGGDTQDDPTYREASYDKDLDRLSLLMIELLCKRLSLTGGERHYQIPSEFAEGV